MTPPRHGGGRDRPGPTARVAADKLRPPRGHEAGRAMMGLALTLLLGCLAARAFLGEHAFRVSPLRTMLPSSAGAAPAGASPLETARATFAVLLAAAFALWAAGAALTRRQGLRCGWLGMLIAGFAVLSLVSGLCADDRRSGLLVWAEQVGILLAGLTAAQLCAERRRWNLLVAVLAAVGLALALKGLSQYFVESAERSDYFRLYGAGELSGLGLPADAPQARMLRARLADPAPFGYFGLTNPFASLLIVLLGAAAGLSADAAVAAARSRRLCPPGRGEVHLPSVGAALGLVGAAVLAVVLLLTGSRAGIASAGVVGLSAAVVAVLRGWLARHWRKAAAAVAAVVVVGWAAVVGYGLRNDSLPGKSMTFRWFYWTASARIVRDRPLLGVGGGNFGAAYLGVRRAEAEEAVKAPHNFVAHAMSQFGLIGGGLYVAAVLAALWAMARPRGQPEETASPTGQVALGSPAPDPPSRRSELVVAAAVVGAVFAGRLAFGEIAADVNLLLVDGLLPAMVLAGAMALCLWLAGALPGRSPAAGTGTRIALACGTAGFVLHNFVEFSLWTPATALAFWTTAGALLGQSRGREVGGRWAVRAAAAGGAILVVVLAAVVLRPIAAKGAHLQQAARRLADEQFEPAVRSLERAAEADPIDAIAAADASRLLVGLTPRGGEHVEPQLRRAYVWALEAVRRDPAASSHRQWAAQVAWLLGWPDGRLYAWRRSARGEQDQGPLDETMPSGPAPPPRRPQEDAEDPVRICELAEAEYLRGRYEQAVALCRRALERAPDSPSLLAHLGDALWQGGEPNQALQSWRQAAQRAPTSEMVGRALEHMDRAAALDPMDHRLRLDYARMLADAGRMDACLEQLEAAGRVNRALLRFGKRYPPESTERFSDRELKDIKMLEDRAEAR